MWDTEEQPATLGTGHFYGTVTDVAGRIIYVLLN